MTTSLPIRFVCDSACCASVRTACSTADLASSDFGLNSFLSSEANSLPWYSIPCSAEAGLTASSAMVWSPLCVGLGAGGVRLARIGQRLEQRLVLDDLGDQLLGAGLAVHVGDQIGQLLARVEQLLQAVDLLRHRRRREVVHALERD